MKRGDKKAFMRELTRNHDKRVFVKFKPLTNELTQSWLSLSAPNNSLSIAMFTNWYRLVMFGTVGAQVQMKRCGATTEVVRFRDENRLKHGWKTQEASTKYFIWAEYKIIDNTDDHWCSFAKQKKRLTSEKNFILLLLNKLAICNTLGVGFVTITSKWCYCLARVGFCQRFCNYL